MKKYNLYALVAAGLLAGGMSVSTASAADLGGNCCADLEERIAELEATTARKGNRKVSLTISGWVGQQITFWDDGVESNTYVHDLGSTLGSNFKFSGSAQISPGWSAGYLLHIEAIGSDSLTTSQGDPSGPSVYNLLGTGGGYNGLQTIQSYWYVKSDQLGKVSVGLVSQASDNTAILVDGSGSLVPANWVAFDVNSFAVRNSAGASLSWGGAQSCAAQGGAWGDCNGLTHNGVRYDSPTFGGFSVSAGWGEDDFWDVAARYAGEFSGFKLAAAVAYNEVRDQNYNNFNALGVSVPDQDYIQAGAFLMHVPTGLFGLVNYGNLDVSGSANEAETWYGKIGLRTRLSGLGHTVFYGEYLNGQDGGGATYAAGAGGGSCVTVPATATDPAFDSCSHPGSELEVWGAGIVQEIDAAAMSVWVKYRNLSYDSGVAGENYEDFNYVGVGGLINF